MNRPLLVGIAAVAVSVAAPCGASAQEATECTAAHADAQRLRKAGELRSAREQLLFCIGGTCPTMLMSDCSAWLAEVDGEMPSFVPGARDASGRELTEVRVLVDGRVVTERLDGKPIPLDPGPHTLRFEGASSPPVEQTLLIKTGEKNRIVSVTLGRPDGEPSPSSLRLAGWVVGGVGVLALGGFGVFALRGQSGYDDLDGCRGNCTPDEVDAVRTDFLIADISLGIGIAALGAGAVLLIYTSGSAPEPKPAGQSGGISAELRPIAGGASASLTGRF